MSGINVKSLNKWTHNVEEKRDTSRCVYSQCVCVRACAHANPSGTAAAGLLLTHRCLIHAEYDYLPLFKDYLGLTLRPLTHLN